MKINTMMLLAVLMIPAAGRVEAGVDCPRAYPSGKSLSYSSGSMFYPNGRSLRYESGSMFYPNGRSLRYNSGSMFYPNGRSLRYESGSMFYPDGRSLRYSSGTLYDSEGRLLPEGSTIRIKLQDNMSVVVGRQRESYEMVVRDGNVDVHIHFDQDQNIYCEFVRN